jgi:hypothetical protein
MTHLDAKKCSKKISEFQKHFPKKTGKKLFKICIKKQQNQEFKTQKREKTKKPDPFLIKTKQKQEKIGQIILILTFSKKD